MKQNRDVLELPNSGISHGDKMRAAQSMSQVPTHLQHHYSHLMNNTSRQEYIETKERTESESNSNISGNLAQISAEVPSDILDSQQDLLSMSRTNPELRKNISLIRNGHKSVMNLQNELMLSKTGGYIPKPKQTMKFAMPWIPQITVDSRQAAHDHNLETLKKTVHVAPPAPRPLFKRQQEFQIPVGVEAIMQREYGHQVKKYQPVRQMYNRPSIALYNPNTIYPQGFNEAELLNRPKPTIKSTFNDDLEVIERRQFKYDAIQVDARPAMTRGGQHNDSRREVLPLHPDAIDQTIFTGPTKLGLQQREHELRNQNPTIGDFNTQAPNQNARGQMLQDDRDFTDNRNQVYQGDLTNRNALQWRNARIQDNKFQKSGAGPASHQTHLQNKSTIRGIQVREDRNQLTQEDQTMGTEITSMKPANNRSISIKPLGFQNNNDTGPIRETGHSARLVNKRGVRIDDRQVRSQENINPTTQTQHHSANIRGLEFQERDFQEPSDFAELGTEVNSNMRHNVRGLSFNERGTSQQKGVTDFESANGFSGGAVLGTSIKDNRSENTKTHAELQEQPGLRTQPQKRGLTFKEKEMQINAPGGTNSRDVVLPGPNNSVRMKFQNPRLVNMAEHPIVEPNEQQGPLITSIRPQLPRMKSRTNKPTFDDYETNMNQRDKIKYRQKEDITTTIPVRPRLERQDAGLNMDLSNQDAPKPLYHRKSNRPTPCATPDYRPPSYRDNREEVAFMKKNSNIPTPY